MSALDEEGLTKTQMNKKGLLGPDKGTKIE